MLRSVLGCRFGGASASFGRAAALFAAAGAVLFLAGQSPASAEYVDHMRVGSITAVNVIENVTTPPGEKLTVRVDLSDQTMFVYMSEKLVHTFKVSTARKGYITPIGRYQAQWLAAKWRSRKYNMAPMPWSVFFHGGYAIHGTSDLKRLGRPASHGCVRLHPDNAKALFRLVEKVGRDNTLIAIVR